MNNFNHTWFPCSHNYHNKDSSKKDKDKQCKEKVSLLLIDGTFQEQIPQAPLVIGYIHFLGFKQQLTSSHVTVPVL